MVTDARRWYDDEGDAGDYEMGEIFETSLTAEHWIDDEGNGLPIGKMQIEEDEILDPDALTEGDPSEEDFEGYTGNAGMTLERWYRHAAIVLWPEARHFAVLCSNGSRKAVPALKQMVAKWQEAKGADAAALKAQCIEFAKAILAKWPEQRYARTYRSEPETEIPDPLKILAELEEPKLIRDFLGDVLVKDASADPGDSIVGLCQQHGWETFQPELSIVMNGTTSETIERNVRLLEQIATARPRKRAGWDELCKSLAEELIPAIEAIDREKPPTDWQAREVKRDEVLAGLVRSLLASGQCELLSQFLAHTLALPPIILTSYPLMTAHIPALESLRPWLKKNLKKPCDGLTHWVAACREQLETLTAREPQKLADYYREAPITCKCPECAEMKGFLQDPREPVHRFRVREERRKHLAARIHESHLDLDYRIEEKGSPYTLVCTKNTNSYQAALKEYHRNQERLTMVQSIEAGLPH